jgi:V-type H+-transporting ATPase subunit C
LRSGNLLVSPLTDVITPRALQQAGAEWIAADSEFLATAVVVVPKTVEEHFLATYAALDAAAVPVGPEGRRDATRGSPVVPGSAVRIAEDADGFVLFTVVILKAFEASFRAACKEKRFTVRDFAYAPALAGSVARVAGELEAEVSAALAVVRDQSRRRYEEAVSNWMHVKMVRTFVEAVLRFGIPVSFAALVVTVEKGTGKKMMDATKSAWKYMAGAAAAFDAMYAPAPTKPVDEDDDQALGPDPLIPGITDAGAPPALPFVWLDFDLRADTAAAAGPK